MALTIADKGKRKIYFILITLILLILSMVFLLLTNHSSKPRIENKPMPIINNVSKPVIKTTPEAPRKPVADNSISNEDLYWLSRVVSAEAKGEPTGGQTAVACVVMNRAKIYGKTIKQTIFAKGQFTSVSNKSIYDVPTDESIKSAKKALSGKVKLPANVYYFYNPKFVSKHNWIRSRRIYKTIGEHVFCYM